MNIPWFIWEELQIFPVNALLIVFWIRALNETKVHHPNINGIKPNSVWVFPLVQSAFHPITFPHEMCCTCLAVRPPSFVRPAEPFLNPFPFSLPLTALSSISLSFFSLPARSSWTTEDVVLKPWQSRKNSNYTVISNGRGKKILSLMFPFVTFTVGLHETIEAEITMNLKKIKNK